MPWITKEGRTVEEARQAAISASGLPPEELDVEVVNEGARGLFGLGGEPAVVRVRPKSEAMDVRAAFRDDLPRPSAVEVETEAAAATGEETARESGEREREAARIGEEIVRGILERMSLAGEVRTRVEGSTVYVEVFGDELGILIGRGGATLQALQEVVRAGVLRRLKARQALVVDVESYWERRRRAQGQGGERRGRRRRPRRRAEASG